METCFSGPALALLAAIGAVLQGAIVTLFWLYVRSSQARTARAEAKEDEWRRVAMRSTDELLPAARKIRGEVRERYRELEEPRS